MSEGQHHPKFDGGPILLGLFGILCGVAIVSVFHYIAMGWCSRRRNRIPSQAYPPHPNHHMSTLSTGNSISGLKVYVYSKEWKEGTCAVCLSEFVEGEEVRILPDCAHAFHVPCVDMWLYSHPNCPLCRTCTTPRGAHIAVSLPSSGELPPPVESLPSSGVLPTPLESFPRYAGLPSPVHHRLSDVDDLVVQL